MLLVAATGSCCWLLAGCCWLLQFRDVVHECSAREDWWRKGLCQWQVKRKLNNLMVKIAGKLPRQLDGQGGAHHVHLKTPHSLLSDGTIVIGADVTHNAAGVSVAGVVASVDASFTVYFHEMRAQTPYVLGGEKLRRRKSEERIIELNCMVEALLCHWRSKSSKGQLPQTVLYYRDGVSDGQFQPVMTFERRQLADAFHRVGGESYNPKLVIIVGQKRHQTRFFPEDLKHEGSKKNGSEASQKGYGKGKKGGLGETSNVPPGTVADLGIARPGHMNFYLVSHQGIKGTSVPCHYHVLHLDERLGVGPDDLQQVTYDLCHLYPRADKTVSYASPAYLADHVCERGKLYLEVHFPSNPDTASLAGASTVSDESRDDARLRAMVEERVDWFNKMRTGVVRTSSQHQGLMTFC